MGSVTHVLNILLPAVFEMLVQAHAQGMPEDLAATQGSGDSMNLHVGM